MSQQIEQNTQELLQTYLTKGIDCVVEQMPDICTQIINVGIINSCIGFIATILGAVLVFILSKYILRHCNEKYSQDPSYTFGIASKILSMVILVVGFCISLYHFLFVYFCPKLYLIEYFGNLVKGR
jgi:hypothetical protein